MRVKCAALPNPELLSCPRAGLLVFADDLLINGNIVLPFLLFWKEVSDRGEERRRGSLWYRVPGVQTNLHLWVIWVSPLQPRWNPLGDPPLVNTLALCHVRFPFWCSNHAGPSDMSQWSRRRYWIIWFVSQSSTPPVIWYFWEVYFPLEMKTLTQPAWCVPEQNPEEA